MRQRGGGEGVMDYLAIEGSSPVVKPLCCEMPGTINLSLFCWSFV